MMALCSVSPGCVLWAPTAPSTQCLWLGKVSGEKHSYCMEMNPSPSPPKKIYPKMDIVKSENPTWFSAAKRILMGSPAPPKHGWLPFCFQPTSLRPKKHNSKESINIMLSSATAAGLAHPPADSSTAGQALPTAPFPSTL